MNKKADITSKQIVTIIILIASFAVIIMFFVMLNLGGTIDKESCKNSVILKDIPLFGNLISLRCKTQDICLSAGEECAGATKETLTMNVGKENYDDIYGKIAQMQEDCFWQMGEGNSDIGEKTCAICSVISFDNEIQKIAQSKPLSREDYFKYLENNIVPNKQTSYLYYFYNQHYWETLKNILRENKKISAVNLPNFDTAKKYFIYYSYLEENSWGIGIEEYTSADIAKLKCKDFATLA